MYNKGNNFEVENSYLCCYTFYAMNTKHEYGLYSPFILQYGTYIKEIKPWVLSEKKTILPHKRQILCSIMQFNSQLCSFCIFHFLNGTEAKWMNLFETSNDIFDEGKTLEFKA